MNNIKEYLLKKGIDKYIQNLIRIVFITAIMLVSFSIAIMGRGYDMFCLSEESAMIAVTIVAQLIVGLVLIFGIPRQKK